MEKTYYCSKCGGLVFPRKKLSKFDSLLEKIFPVSFGRDFCDHCGEPTETAVSYACQNGHNVYKYMTYCPCCGIKVKEENLPKIA